MCVEESVEERKWKREERERRESRGKERKEEELVAATFGPDSVRTRGVSLSTTPSLPSILPRHTTATVLSSPDPHLLSSCLSLYLFPSIILLDHSVY